LTPVAAKSPAELLIEISAFSPEIFDWIALQLKAGRRPSEILAMAAESVIGPANDNCPRRPN
jgi:hypothetical protein